MPVLNFFVRFSSRIGLLRPWRGSIIGNGKVLCYTRCRVTSTFDEATARESIGTYLSGKVVRAECESYDGDPRDGRDN